MKTLKSFLFIVCLLLFASLKSEAYFESVVTNPNALKVLIGEKFSNDMSRTGNYLYENEIKKIDSEVKITFLIDHAGQINILKIDSDNYDAAAYAKSLLHMKKINVNEDLKGKKYKMTVKLNFKAV